MTSGIAASFRRTAQLCHALSDETRLEILARLRDGERCVCYLTEALEVAQSRLSFHLKTLKDAGLVTDRRDGRWAYYAITPAAREEFSAALDLLKPRPAPAPTAVCCQQDLVQGER